MKVRELKNILSEYPESADVFIQIDTTKPCDFEITRVECITKDNVSLMRLCVD